MEGLNGPNLKMGVEAFRAYVASYDQLRRNIMLIVLPGGEPVGLIMVEADLRHRLASLHLLIGDASAREQRIGFTAARIALWHLFLERKFEKVTFEPLVRNTRAIEICRAAFLRQEGELKSHRIDSRTGERIDQLVFAITLDEFQARIRIAPELPVFQGPGISKNFVTDTAMALGRKTHG